MQKRFVVLDSFRGLCAVAVVLFHTHLIGSFIEIDFFRRSSIFVQFFFVLSGFVLAHGYGYKENLSFKSYFKARFFRIYPLHIFMFSVFIFLECVRLFSVQFWGLTFINEPFTETYALKEIIPNILLIQSWSQYTHKLSFNAPSWSISVEFFLYIVLFFTVLYSGKFKHIVWLIITLGMIMSLFIDFRILTTQVSIGLICFFGGAVTYSIYRRIFFYKPPVALSSFVEFGLLLSVFYVVQSDMEYRIYAVNILFAITILTFSFEAGIFSNILKLPAFRFTGKLSYSIYMTHAAILFCLNFILVIIQKITGMPLISVVDGVHYLTSGNVMANNLLVFIILAFVFCASHLTYKHIELKWLLFGKGISKNSN